MVAEAGDPDLRLEARITLGILAVVPAVELKAGAFNPVC